MTTAELNRDIKKLYNNQVKAFADLGIEEFTEYKKNVLKPEWLRLYGADREMKYMTAKSIKIMIVLNRKWRIIHAHEFGLFINEKTF